MCEKGACVCGSVYVYLGMRVHIGVVVIVHGLVCKCKCVYRLYVAVNIYRWDGRL